MKRTDQEIINAMNFIKQKHNGEMPYKFGTFECAVMMAKYLKHETESQNRKHPKRTVIVSKGELCKCGAELIKDVVGDEYCGNTLCKKNKM